jgi:hypothetical protein
LKTTTLLNAHKRERHNNERTLKEKDTKETRNITLPAISIYKESFKQKKKKKSIYKEW